MARVCDERWRVRTRRERARAGVTRIPDAHAVVSSGTVATRELRALIREYTCGEGHVSQNLRRTPLEPDNWAISRDVAGKAAGQRNDET
jgi:hypothetical protein